jgi:regulator of protease activity HflC (stomatin/prohibitin superfamily)
VSTGILTAIVALVLLIVVAACVRRVPPQRAYVLDVFGHYRRTLGPGVHLVIPLVESVRAKVDLAEQVASFPPQPAITLDNLVACIGTVLYYRVADPARATYEIANYRQALEMLTITILRNVIGSMALERARTSRNEINWQLTAGLNENTGSWGIEVIRTEIPAIESGSRQGCT